jgi:hypothetical protein
MRKLLKVAAGLAAAVLLFAGGGLGALAMRKPAQRPAPQGKIEATPERLARGEYLVHHISGCYHCHSDFQPGLYTAPTLPGTEGRGGFAFDEKLGIPGVVQAQNITPDLETGIGAWTDGEVLRAIREGIKKDGSALFPQMPYQAYRQMSDGDAQAVVAFLRTAKALRHPIAPRRLNFPVNLLVKLSPQPLDGPVAAPDDVKDHLGYGKYLVTIAGCAECHTPMDDKGNRLHDRELAGGWEMKLPFGRVVTSNLTPAPGTWTGQVTKEQFIGRFKAFEGLQPEPAGPGRNTVMGWYEYAGMTERDLGAIYDYLQTLPPQGGPVDPFPDAPDSKDAVAAQ